MVNIRQKGSKAELEWIERFQKFFPEKLDRNLDQTRYGGSDVRFTEPFCVELKRVEDCSIGNRNNWWKQVKKAAKDNEIPVVGYRPSRKGWRFLLPAEMLHTYNGFVQTDDWCEVSETVFILMVLKVFEVKET